MDLTAPHIAFVLAAYGISALVIAVLIAAILMHDRKTRRELDGMKDRSP
jgi:heme exporter protein CcmD